MENKYIQYSIFSGIVHHQDVKQKLSLKLDLREEVSRGFLTLNELEVIVDKVNEYFESVDFQKLNKKQLKENYIMFLIVRIFVKLTMLAPAKRQIICDIRANDFDSDYKMVTINSQKIALPRSFTSEIKETLKFIKNLREYKEIEENQRVFDYIYGKFYKDENITAHLATFSSYMDLDYILVDSRKKNNKKYQTC